MSDCSEEVTLSFVSLLRGDHSLTRFKAVVSKTLAEIVFSIRGLKICKKAITISVSAIRRL